MYVIIHMKKNLQVWYKFFKTQPYNLFVKKYFKVFEVYFSSYDQFKSMCHRCHIVKYRVKKKRKEKKHLHISAAAAAAVVGVGVVGRRGGMWRPSGAGRGGVRWATWRVSRRCWRWPRWRRRRRARASRTSWRASPSCSPASACAPRPAFGWLCAPRQRWVIAI